MKVNKLALIAILPLMLGIVACNETSVKNEEVLESESAEQQVEELSVDKPVEDVVLVSNTNKYFSDEEYLVDGISSSDYKDLNTYGSAVDFNVMWLKSFMVNKTIEQSPGDNLDEFKLLSMSPEYREETDGFKKKDIAKRILPEIDAELDKYNGVHKVKLPIIPQTQVNSFDMIQNDKDLTAFKVSAPSLKNYNFESKQFPMDSCNFNISHNYFNIDGKSDFFGAPIETKSYGKYDCGLDITDETLARKIEEAINDSNIDYKGEVYYELSYTKGEYKVYAEPILARVKYLNKSTGEELASKEFKFDKKLFR